MIDDQTTQHFQAIVWNYYHQHGRHDLPWRQPEPNGGFDVYKIMVSEIMLQQTQVSRVIPKYLAFLELFPTVRALAEADQSEVLRAWSGLGYNRRARFLHQTAKAVMDASAGAFPSRVSELARLSGIGPNTAGAIAAYAYNEPVVFIETNSRTVYIHHFFNDHMAITDKEILAVIAETLDQEQPREWHWALMDYGSFLKQSVGNLNRRSRSYAKQSTFHGSKRQIRGQVLRLLGDTPMTRSELARHITDQRLESVVTDLLQESLIHEKTGYLHL